MIRRLHPTILILALTLTLTLTLTGVACMQLVGKP
jgi:hypothetical protein